MIYDVVVVGGGPGGLAAALTLGRARKRVLLCDGGPRRNRAATHVHNFLTRDGTPPDEMRGIARDQLARYPAVEVRNVEVRAITGARGAFRVTLDGTEVETRRILLATGMVDELLPIPGFEALWGRSLFQCPYCHGWEIQDRRWGYLGRAADVAHLVPFALMALSWTRDLVVFTGGAFELDPADRGRLETAGIVVETSPITRLEGRDGALTAVVLDDGRSVAREALFVHPPQRQVALVKALGLALDRDGFVEVDPARRETSVPGIYASGDLTSRLQSAIVAAASGMQAAGMINTELSMELALAGQL